MTRPREDSRPAGREGRTGRRTGDSGTREAILDAARQRFGDNGYERATIRGIAADAGVDAALVHHYYGNKERLFAAAMRLPIIPGDLLDAALAPGSRAPGQGMGEHLVRSALAAWDVPEVRATFLGLLRTAVTSEQAAAMLREFIAASILGRIAGAVAAGPAAGPGARDAPAAGSGSGAGSGNGAGPKDAERRAALVASQMLGLALARYVLGIEPLASANADELTAAIGPTVERYLTGEVP